MRYAAVIFSQNLLAQSTGKISYTMEVPVFADIPRYFTPNNDGINDVWEWPNVEQYQNSRVVIFNRFGQKIFETD